MYVQSALINVLYAAQHALLNLDHNANGNQKMIYVTPTGVAHHDLPLVVDQYNSEKDGDQDPDWKTMSGGNGNNLQRPKHASPSTISRISGGCHSAECFRHLGKIRDDIGQGVNVKKSDISVQQISIPIPFSKLKIGGQKENEDESNNSGGGYDGGDDKPVPVPTDPNDPDKDKDEDPSHWMCLIPAAIGAVIGMSPAILITALGFAAAGVVAGSPAALIQSYIGNVAADSLFAMLQSLGATGALLIPGAALGAAAGFVLCVVFPDEFNSVLNEIQHRFTDLLDKLSESGLGNKLSSFLSNLEQAIAEFFHDLYRSILESIGIHA